MDANVEIKIKSLEVAKDLIVSGKYINTNKEPANNAFSTTNDFISLATAIETYIKS